jgi:ubiquinone/menaquinone biosynthesis C-methylase UbiE
VIPHFDLVAPWYERTMGRVDGAHLRDLLRLPTDGWLIDVGGGTGRVAAPLRAGVSNLVVADLSWPMLRQARMKDGLSVVQARAERLPFNDGSFARVLVVDALHHFADQEGAIAELVRVLARGGRLVIEEGDTRRFSVRLVAWAEKMALMRSHFLSLSAIQAMVSAHSLSVHVDAGSGSKAWIVADK